MAGDSGEFYTPRAVVRLMVELTDPRLGESVLDPASGTGGFLVEAYNYLQPHTIVRLPNGVFAPYTGIPTNLLFFDRKNPSAKDNITHLPPEQLAASILEKEKRIGEIVARIQKLLRQ